MGFRGFKQLKAKAALARNNDVDTTLSARITSLEQGSALTPVVTKTSNYSATIADRTILCDATSGDITITLPNPSLANPFGFSMVVSISKIDSSANTVTIAPYASETIAGDSSFVLVAQNEVLTLCTNNTNWYLKD